MNPQNSQSDTTPQPVAYDADGRPLYHHPPQMNTAPTITPETVSQMPQSHVTTRPSSVDGQNFNPQIRSQYANEPNVIHTTRPVEPQQFTVSDELRRKHEESVRDYPQLNLSEAEYVILDIKRHPIGMIVPVAITGLLVVAILGFVVIYPSIYSSMAVAALAPEPAALFGMALILIFLVFLGGAAVLWVYLQNQFFMTNESVIQEIQESLFSRHEQTVSLGSIEDASFRQTGIMQMLFNYGTIRLSTEGEETTYTFRWVTQPKRQIAILNNAIEDFKNGRPVRYNDTVTGVHN